MKASLASGTWTTAFMALAVFGLVACGSTSPDAKSHDPPSERASGGGPADPVDTASDEELSGPPDVRVRYASEFVDLPAWTFCYGALCADGMPPSNPPDVGTPDQVVVEYPLEQWTFKASFQSAGQTCAQTFPAKLNEIEPGRFVLRPAGYAGEYDVTLSGRGPGGEAFVTFRWTTPSDGPLPSPSAYVGIIADNGGPGSYGVEMNVSQLSDEPDQVEATITVTAADGDSLTLSPTLTRDCQLDGSLWWDGPNTKGTEAANLGPAPFTYDVELVLDGRTYAAHATWPDDLIPGLAPYVRLNFSPELPALE
jgi:hypothetical protein